MQVDSVSRCRNFDALVGQRYHAAIHEPIPRLEESNHQGTKNWILYEPITGCLVLGQVTSPIDCHIELPADRFLDAEFACEGKFGKAMQKIRDGLSQLKSGRTDVDEQQREKLSAELNAYYTRCGDAAVAKTMAWAQRHPRDDWQSRVVAADQSGHWSAPGLRSGHYILVIRASLGHVDAYSLYTDPPSGRGWANANSFAKDTAFE